MATKQTKQIWTINDEVLSVFRGMCFALSKEFLLNGIQQLTLELPDGKQSTSTMIDSKAGGSQERTPPVDFWQGKKIHGMIEGEARKNFLRGIRLENKTDSTKITIETENPIINQLHGKQIAILILDNEVQNG